MGVQAKIEQSALNRLPTMGEGDIDTSLLWDWFTKAKNFLQHKAIPPKDMVKTVAYRMSSVHAIHWLAAAGPLLDRMDWDTYKEQMRGNCPFMDFALEVMGKNNLLAGTPSFMNDDFLRDVMEAGMEPDLAQECHHENANAFLDFRPWLDEVKRLNKQR
ncbi:hypothetical protein BDN71DRAFT_1432689 [Pleurotus eryngii]|uniref:Uncharacterized protein n=1 Tax=Pleurotus eryngii TaxID=5323 RepID=A0A9P6D6P9_PLEER|nr:hypothetical protein BDN71DRAFT_1432689 [Pleurotus eryngii]